MKKYPFIILLATFWMASCAEKAPATDETSQTSVQEPVAPAEKWFKVDYDDVRMRDAAGMKAKVLATLKYGTIVKDLAGKSDFTTKVTLRGEEKDDYWLKVRTIQGIEGWIYGGAVSETAAPKNLPETSSNFSAELDKIDDKNCACLNTAIEKFKTSFAGESPEMVDQELPVLQDYLRKATYGFNDEIVEKPYYDDFLLTEYNGEGKIIPKAVLADKARYEKCGMSFIFVEGSAILILKPGLVLDNLGTMFSPNMRRYLGQLKKEDAAQWSDDGGLIIPVLDVAKRAVFWDQFSKDVPKFIFAAEAIVNNKNYTGTLMGGMDNTPSFDFGDKRILNAEYKKAYEWIMKEHPNTETGRTIKEYYLLLKETNFENNDKARKYLEKYWED